MDRGADGVKEEQKETYSVIVFQGSLTPKKYEHMIYSKWLRSLRYGNDYFKLINSDNYYETYKRFIKVLIGRAGSMVRLAVLSEDHDVVLGWSLIEKDVLHYVHVQSEQRMKGIGKSLVPIEVKSFSHITRTGMNIWHNKLPNAQFDPFK